MPAVASPEKRAANRRNALKSTGPRTELGKKLAAQNSTRHGLSVPPGPGAAPLINELTAVLEGEGISQAQAKDLALKIMEYERNLSHELDQLRVKPVDTSKQKRTQLEQDESDDEAEEGLRLLDPIARKYFPEFEPMMEDYLLDSQFRRVKPSSKDLREIQQMAARAHRLSWRLENQQVKERLIGQGRYMKRATNQLIKAIKAL